MVNTSNSELVARCVPLAVQPTTISQNSATDYATVNATNGLKALANAVLERNRQCNYNATDAPKPTQFLPVNNSGKVTLVPPQLQGVLPESDKQKISAWVRSLGGSEETILEETAQTLGQCRNDPEALVYYLRRAADVLPRPPKQEAQPVTCHACNNFTPHHAHGKGTGTCTAGVMPSGVCHWHDAQHTCNQFNCKSTVDNEGFNSAIINQKEGNP
jgi:hypothetical protein